MTKLFKHEKTYLRRTDVIIHYMSKPVYRDKPPKRGFAWLVA